MEKKVVVPKAEVAHAETVVQASKVEHADIVELTGGSSADARLQQAQEAKQEELAHTSLGQRRINLIWEFTQASIAVGVTIATLWASTSLTLRGDAGEAAFLLLSNSFFLVIGFYFGRTNHQKIGGVGGTDQGR